MPSKFRLRYIFKPIVRVLAKALIKLNITPNGATIIMLCFSILSLFSLVFLQNSLLFAIFVFLCGLTDGIDGAIARLTGRSTAFGGFFDSFMDRLSEFFIFFALLIHCWENVLWKMIDMKLVIYISFVASVMISYCRARAELFYKGDFDIGLMARSERLFYIFITNILAFFYGFFMEFMFIYMWLVLGTFFFRFTKIYNQISKQKEDK